MVKGPHMVAAGLQQVVKLAVLPEGLQSQGLGLYGAHQNPSMRFSLILPQFPGRVQLFHSHACVVTGFMVKSG
jgi:hypothetical protein